MDTSSLRHFLLILIAFDLCVSHVQTGTPAPCMGCRLFNFGPRDNQKDEKTGSVCRYPCQCPVETLECQSGVSTIRDGCGCCYMCARQLGDMCSKRDKCDDVKKLRCSAKGDNETGTCLGENKKPCNVMGAIYQDGESFYMGCSKICTCQNGFHGCVDQCPQERVKPSELTCHDPKLMEVKGKCCKEWTCQKLDTAGQVLSRDKGLESGSLIMKNPLWYRTSTPISTTTGPTSPIPNYGRVCRATKSDWSPCSVTCGVGVSVRLVVDRATCKNREEQQLCYLRPCGVKVATLGRDKCTPTTRSASKQRIQFQDCISVKKYRPKFCTTCKEGSCCYPNKYRTRSIKFQCTDGNIEELDFMWIRKCRCRSKCYMSEDHEKPERRRGRKWREKRKKWKRRQRKRKRQQRRKNRKYKWGDKS